MPEDNGQALKKRLMPEIRGNEALDASFRKPLRLVKREMLTPIDYPPII